ncbi:hypothetical protein [Arthrobacter sp. D5-1]|uniref:hypothetical protein n=1 Tax=Arthrobacter sp. D5-1 TaxID=1477518 RepID=UPI001A98544E|nr:hypothetical protein [Arthrobacter sp. D5-1]QSZ49899.1 hypothetical protein AYX22_16775 [Arthrobacter sp. D5-1]
MAKSKRFTGGNAIPDEYTKDLPIALVPIFSMNKSDVAHLLQTIYAAQSITMGFRPILFTDQDIFSAVRPYGWVIEHVLDERTWLELSCSGDWLTAVLRRAQSVSDFLNVATVLVPDPISHNRGFLSQIETLTGTKVDVLSGLQQPVSVDGSSVVGWRGWFDRVVGHESSFTVSAGKVVGKIRVRRGSSGDTILIDAECLDQEGLTRILGEALRRGWSYIVFDDLFQFSDQELSLMLGSVLDGLTPDGTLLTATSPETAKTVRSATEDERVLASEVVGNSLVSAGRPINLADAEMQSLVYRASRALVGRGDGWHEHKLLGESS